MKITTKPNKSAKRTLALNENAIRSFVLLQDSDEATTNPATAPPPGTQTTWDGTAGESRRSLREAVGAVALQLLGPDNKPP
jgi:hypothetical protein